MGYVILIVIGIFVLYKVTPIIMTFLGLFGWGVIDSGKNKKRQKRVKEELENPYKTQKQAQVAGQGKE